MNLMNKWQITFIIYRCFKFDIVFVGHVNHHLEGLMNNVGEVKVLTCELELVIFKLRQVQEVVDEVARHLLREDQLVQCYDALISLLLDHSMTFVIKFFIERIDVYDATQLTLVHYLIFHLFKIS